MPKQIYHPMAQKALGTLDPTLVASLRRIEEAMEAVRSGDGTLYADRWASESEDPDIFYPQMGAPTIYGDTVRQVFRGFQTKGATPVELTTEYQRIVQVGDLALAVLIERAPYGSDAPKDVELKGYVTYVLRRFGDDWKIIYRTVHPMDKASGHTYNVYTCPKCSVSLVDVMFKNHCYGAHGMTYTETEKFVAGLTPDN
jgi:ketosteroid isomerase-like protein